MLNFKVKVKMITDRSTGDPAGYCFVQFASHELAQRAIAYHASFIPGTDIAFKLKWASYDDSRSTESYDSSSSGSSATILAGSTESWTKQDSEVVGDEPVPKPMGNTKQNKFSSSEYYDRLSGYWPQFSIYVGNLDPDVTDSQLYDLFVTRYPSVRSARIMIDGYSGVSRGYGFVRFADEGEYGRALQEMRSCLFGGRLIRISPAAPRTRPSVVPCDVKMMSPAASNVSDPVESGGARSGGSSRTPSVGSIGYMDSPPTNRIYGSAMTYVHPVAVVGGNPFVDGLGYATMVYAPAYVPVQVPMQGEYVGYADVYDTSLQLIHESAQDDAVYDESEQEEREDENKTLFVGGLYNVVSENEIRSVFSKYGEIVYIRLPADKACGFVEFADRASAEAAMSGLEGARIRNNRMRLSWGKAHMRKRRVKRFSKENNESHASVESVAVGGDASIVASESI